MCVCVYSRQSSSIYFLDFRYSFNHRNVRACMKRMMTAPAWECICAQRNMQIFFGACCVLFSLSSFFVFISSFYRWREKRFLREMSTALWQLWLRMKNLFAFMLSGLALPASVSADVCVCECVLFISFVFFLSPSPASCYSINHQPKIVGTKL